MILVTLVMPVLNEAQYLEGVIDSILQQDFSHSKMEIIFVDGNSTDNSVDLIKEKMDSTEIAYKIITNYKKKTPISVNMGIKESSGRYILRLDAHTIYNKKYISLCIYYLNKTGAQNVGCLIETRGYGIKGKAIARLLSSKFGVGNSEFRTNGKSGFVDTVPFGCFERCLFDKIGYFNETLLRSEDNEFNFRIIKNGGKIYLFNDIKNLYIPRNTVLKLLKMGFKNGKEIIITSLTISKKINIRHLVPLLFFISIMIYLIGQFFNDIFHVFFAIELILYLSLDILFSFKQTKDSFFVHFIEICICPLFHITYGMGSFVGVVDVLLGGGKPK